MDDVFRGLPLHSAPYPCWPAPWALLAGGLGSENGPYIVLLNFFAEVQRRIP